MIKLHRHAKRRCKERGATAAEVVETVARGAAKASKLNRTMFSRTFAFGKTWLGTYYAKKKIEAFAAQQPDGTGW